MKKIALFAVAASAVAIPQTAFAQDAAGPEVTVGVSAGYHDLGVSDSDEDLVGADIDDNGLIFGGYVSVDFPVGENLFAGVEGNGNIGTSAIDSDYGASVRLGYRTENGTKLYVRGGYQFIDLDLEGLLNIEDDDFFDDDDFDDTIDDYLVGIGAEVPFGQWSFRGNLDTVSFDTVRATVGMGYTF